MEEYPTSKTLRDYLVILVGYIISSLGSKVVNFSIIWWITIETTNVFYISLASSLTILPLMIILPLMGVLSDILNRKYVLIITSALHILTIIIFIFLFASGMQILIPIFIFLLINNLFEAFYQPTYFAIVPLMVSQRHLGRINGLAYILTMLPLMFAPIITGILLTVFPMIQILWVGVISNGIMLIIVFLIKIPQVKEIRLKTKDHEVKPFIIHYFHQFLEGFKTLVNLPGILILLGVIFILDLFIFPFNTMFSSYIQVIHNGTIHEYAIISSISFWGMVIGIILFLIKKFWNPVILIFFLSIFLTFLGNLVVIFAPYRSFGLMSITFFISSGLLPVFINIILPTLIQSNIPNNMLGRVSAIYISIVSLIPLFASFLLGLTLLLISDVTLVLLLSTIVGMASIILMYMFSGIRKIRFENYKIIDNFDNNHN